MTIGETGGVSSDIQEMACTLQGRAGALGPDTINLMAAAADRGFAVASAVASAAQDITAQGNEQLNVARSKTAHGVSEKTNDGQLK